MTPLSQSFLGRDLGRRAFILRAMSGAGFLSLPHFMRLRAEASQVPGAKKRSLILLWQDGGPSHFETFDPKPEAPIEFRGELGGIQTTLPGIQFCEVLPRLGGLAHRFSVIRSLHQPSSDHVVGSHNVLTGWDGESDGSKSRYPDLASVISRKRAEEADGSAQIGESTDPRLALGLKKSGPRRDAGSARHELPRYVDISSGLHRGGPAFLGPIHAPFAVEGDPSKPDFVVQNLRMNGSLSERDERLKMLRELDRYGQSSLRESSVVFAEQMRATDAFRGQALDLLTGSGAARAFDLSREPELVRRRYGVHTSGQQCLLARRLVEAGVNVVAVRFCPDGRGDYEKPMIGWDDHAVHGDIFEIMRQRGPQFDQSVSALIEDLLDRGLEDEVLVVVAGEFGRTPRVHVHKGCPGREHWGPAGCALVFGGGLNMGQVVGSTNDKGEQPQDRPLKYQSLLATIYHSLGINIEHTFVNSAGRPVPILSHGEVISELANVSRADVRQAEAIRPKQIGALAVPPQSLTLTPGATVDMLARSQPLVELRTLIACDSRLDNAALAYMAGFPNLVRLDLNGAPVSDAGLAHLAGLTDLEELNLTGTAVSDAGLSHLKRLTRLRKLSIAGSQITLSGVVRLFTNGQQRSLVNALVALDLAAVDEYGNVHSINVAGTHFGDEEMKHLQFVPTLKELHLTATQVTDAGMVHLKGLTGLERLFIAKCQVGDTGLAHVAVLPELRVLNIYGTQITSAGLEHLSRLRNLKTLYITDLKLKPAVVDRLKQTLPDLKVTDYTAE